MEVLVLGSGAREHALAWRLAADDSVTRVSVAPGNAGTTAVARNIPDLDILDPGAVARHAARERYGLVVVGPDAPLEAGVADALEGAGIPVLGPRRDAARLEWSKAFAKDVLRRAGVPTAEATAFADAEGALAHARARDDAGARVVVKADWLALGKGVVVPETLAETEQAIRRLFDTPEGRRPGARILLEERLDGREVSVFALVSGERVVPLAAACDHKRLHEGDLGPNTGGMGAYAPVPWFRAAEIERTTADLLEPVAWRMARDGAPYRGVLYAGLMIGSAGARVLEFNARFGDPEAEVILPLVDGDLAAALLACARGDAREMERDVAWRDGAAVAVVLASEGYPDAPVSGRPLRGADPAALDDRPVPAHGGVLCFHGATRRRGDGALESAGGRVVTFVGVGRDLARARETVYAAVASCRLEGAHFRRDIAAAVAESEREPAAAGRGAIS